MNFAAARDEFDDERSRRGEMISDMVREVDEVLRLMRRKPGMILMFCFSWDFLFHLITVYLICSWSFVFVRFISCY